MKPPCVKKRLAAPRAGKVSCLERYYVGQQSADSEHHKHWGTSPTGNLANKPDSHRGQYPIQDDLPSHHPTSSIFHPSLAIHSRIFTCLTALVKLSRSAHNVRMGKKRAPKTPDAGTFAANVMNQLLGRIDPDGPPLKPADLGGKNPAAVALGRLGGLKGGPARAKKLGKKKLSQIGKRAAKARWKKSSISSSS